MRDTLGFILGGMTCLILVLAITTLVTPPPAPVEPPAPRIALAPPPAPIGGDAPTAPLRRLTIERPDAAFDAPATWRLMTAQELQEAAEENGDERPDASIIIGLARDVGAPEVETALFISRLGLRDGAPLDALSLFSSTMSAMSWFDWLLFDGGLDVTRPAETHEINGLPAASFRAISTDANGVSSAVGTSVIDFAFDRVLFTYIADTDQATAEAEAILASLRPL